MFALEFRWELVVRGALCYFVDTPLLSLLGLDFPRSKMFKTRSDQVSRSSSVLSLLTG